MLQNQRVLDDPGRPEALHDEPDAQGCLEEGLREDHDDRERGDLLVEAEEFGDGRGDGQAAPDQAQYGQRPRDLPDRYSR